MNNRQTICLIIAIATLLLIPIQLVQSQDYYVYNVQVKADRSAVWTITEFTSANATVETWENFQQKIFNLIESASTATHRPMDIDEGSLQINTTLSLDSKITEYTFVWQNFTATNNKELVFGDVFQVNNFFGQLFGDAALQLSYPDAFNVRSVTPQPYQRDDALHLLKWARTQDLANANVNVVLASDDQSTGGSNPLQSNIFSIAIAAIVIPVSAIGFYAFKKRRNNNQQTSTAPSQPSVIETEEDKILKLLKTAGGSMRQTEITERLGFSKAKTSQLLTALEGRGLLARYKKGRDKIVTVNRRENS